MSCHTVRACVLLEETGRHCEVKIRVRFPPLIQKIPSGLSEPPEDAGTANAVNPNIRRAEDRKVEIENDGSCQVDL